MLLRVEVIKITEEIGLGLEIETGILKTPEGEIASRTEVRTEARIEARTEAIRGLRTESRIRTEEMIEESIGMQTEGKFRV
jgi:hypothetical protein